jgi:hypothetical protein
LKHSAHCTELTKQKKTLRPSEYKSKLKNLKQSYKLLYKLENNNFKNMMPKENPKKVRKRSIDIMNEISYRSGIHDEIRLATEAIQLYQYIHTTQLYLKTQKKENKKKMNNNNTTIQTSTSVLDLKRVSNLPTDLILFIRDFIPYEIRVKLMQEKFNLYAFIKTRCSVDINKNIINSPNFYNHFHSHPLYNLMYDRTTFDTRYFINGLNSKRYNQDKLCTYLRFKALYLLFKTTYPKFAFIILKTLKNIDPNTTSKNIILKI